MLARQYAKLCDVADFADPELAALIPDIVPGGDADRPHRKHWEFARGAMFLREMQRLDGADILDVGAGSEAILYWLARYARRVVGVDIYGEGGFADREAVSSVVTDPAAFAPYPYPEDRLELRYMDARQLDFPSASFDAVVSFSSIEHFGSPSDIVRAASEIGRVLRPGGVAFITTETFVHLHPLDRAPVMLAVRALTLGRRCASVTLRRRAIDGFTERELERRIIIPSGLRLAQPIDTALSPTARNNPIVVSPHGGFRAPSGREYPHTFIRANQSTFTSVGLPFVKPRV